MEGSEEKDTKNRGNLIRWNWTFQIHNAMMIYLLSCLWHFSQILLIDIMINIRFVFHPSHSLLSFVSRFDNLLSDYFPFYICFFDTWHGFFYVDRLIMIEVSFSMSFQKMYNLFQCGLFHFSNNFKKYLNQSQSLLMIFVSYSMSFQKNISIFFKAS